MKGTHKSELSAEQVDYLESSGMTFNDEGYLVNKEPYPTGGDTLDLTGVV